MKKEILLLAAAFSWSAIHLSNAVTIPAGTQLSVRTGETIASNEHVGKVFAAQLDHDVLVGGRIALRAGSRVAGRVDSSRRLSTGHLVLDITHVLIRGHGVPIKTVNGFRADDNRFKTRGGVSIGSGGYYRIPAGLRMHFRLALPVDLGGNHH